MKLTNDITLLAFSMGQLFRVTHIVSDTTLANKICEQEPNSGVIATDDKDRIYIAELTPIETDGPNNLMDDRLSG